MHWDIKTFAALSNKEVHAILALRQQIFIVEQQSLYQDADDIDELAYHILGKNSDEKLIAYARINPPHSQYAEPSIGRIVIHPSARGQGLGQALLRESLRQCQQLYPELPVRLSAQTYLIQFYQGFGFNTMGQAYDDAGIEHIDMVLMP